MSLNVTIPDTFSGPLDLLLHLIRRDEMDIYDIPVSQLTGAYLQELEKLSVIDVDEGAEFLDLASRLLEIKSRMLVPAGEAEENAEDEDGDFDPRGGLVEALLEYRRFKDAAKMLGDMAEEQARRYPRVSPKMEFSLPPQASATSANDLMRAFRNLLDRMLGDASDRPDVITYTEVSIATRARQIVENLAAVGKTRFSRLLSDKSTKNEMVGLFIALLELVRQGRIVARQSDNFSDIIIEHRAAPTSIPAAAASSVRLPPAPFLPVVSHARKREKTGKFTHAPLSFPQPPPVSPVSRKAAPAGGLRSSAPRSLFPVFSGGRSAQRKRTAR